MFRLYGGGLIGLAFLLFWVWAIFDVIATDDTRVRNLPKLLWLVLVVLLGAIGSLAWTFLGRPQGATFAPGGRTVRRGYGEPVWMEEEQRRQRYAELDEELDRRLEERRRREAEGQGEGEGEGGTSGERGP